MGGCSDGVWGRGEVWRCLEVTLLGEGQLWGKVARGGCAVVSEGSSWKRNGVETRAEQSWG